MVSHTTFNGIRLTLGKRGMAFTKRPSRFNRCIGKEMRGKSYGAQAEVHKAFEAAVAKCKR